MEAPARLVLGAYSSPVLILNMLLKIRDAQNYQNAENAVSTHVLHTRNLRGISFIGPLLAVSLFDSLSNESHRFFRYALSSG